jgi:hypothetical protein
MVLGDDVSSQCAAREVNWKCKFTAKGNETARDVCSRNGARISCIQKDQNFLKSHTDRVHWFHIIFRPFVRYQLMHLTNIGLWLAPNKMWQLIFNRSIASQQAPKNLLSLLTTIV